MRIRIDTYSKVAFAKLYTTKTPITAADVPVSEPELDPLPDGWGRHFGMLGRR